MLNQATLDGIRSMERPGMPSLLLRVIEAYLNNLPAQVSKIRGAAEAHDITALGSAAHALKSGSGNVGADELAQSCALLEAAAKNADLNKALQLAQDVDSLIEPTAAALRELASSTQAAH